MRSASVNNGRLACIAVIHKLHCYLRQCSSPLFNVISDFLTSFSDVIDAQQQKDQQDVPPGSSSAGGKQVQNLTIASSPRCESPAGRSKHADDVAFVDS